MRKGEKGILIGVVAFAVVAMSYKAWQASEVTEKDPGIPFYTTSSDEFATKASVLYRKYECRDCHSLWGLRNIMQAVPAPSLDGMGSIREEEWLYSYFSAENPQSIIPSRLKLRYQMPSFAKIPETDRRMLAKYISSLKVEDWFLEETKKMRYEKLTGKDYQK
ncbi:MAG: c-type cytochrome [Ectothiorhodospiraceae bacterium]|nr:c-type cytochrome [Ectothiorhodospiraceae bacterium]